VRADDVGDWRDVLAELPPRIHEWMPRLAEEGVVGADAIFACLGPALEVFSRYSRVEKASGETVALKLNIWSTSGLPLPRRHWPKYSRMPTPPLLNPMHGLPQCGYGRLTQAQLVARGGDEEHDGSGDDDDTKGKGRQSQGWFRSRIRCRAARFPRGLGAQTLDDLKHVVEVSGETGTPAARHTERTQYLFGKDQAQTPSGGRKKKSGADGLVRRACPCRRQ
jgi:putative DNA methylase